MLSFEWGKCPYGGTKYPSNIGYREAGKIGHATFRSSPHHVVRSGIPTPDAGNKPMASRFLQIIRKCQVQDAELYS